MDRIARNRAGDPPSNAAPSGVDRAADDEPGLLARARGGDRAAATTLVERHQERVWRLAFRLARGDRSRAEDLAQEAFLRALRGLATFRGDAAFGTWMHRIVLNLHLNREGTLAARAERGTLSIGTPIERGGRELRAIDPKAVGAAPLDEAILAEEQRQLHAALDELEEDRRVVVLLRDVEGRSYEEIAALLDVPIGTVRSRLARAREQLCQRLAGGAWRDR